MHTSRDRKQMSVDVKGRVEGARERLLIGTGFLLGVMRKF